MGIQFAMQRVRGCQALDISRSMRLHISMERMEAYGEHMHINELLKLCDDSLQVFRVKFTPSRHSTWMAIEKFEKFVNLLFYVSE